MAAKDAVALATTTAAFKLVITSTKKDWLALPSPAECKDSVQQLRAHIQPFQFELSEELEQELKDWESGKKLDESGLQSICAGAPPSAPLLCPAPAAPELSAAEVVPVVPTGSFSSASKPEAADVVPEVAEVVPGSLREKIAAAKRRKMF